MIEIDPDTQAIAIGGIVSIERRHTNQRMSQSVVHNGVVYLAGQVAQNAKGGTVTEQTRDILARIDELLAEVGANKDTILSAQIWISDMGTFAELNAVWDDWVGEGNAPARACTEANLATPEFTVEIMVTAVT